MRYILVLFIVSTFLACKSATLPKLPEDKRIELIRNTNMLDIIYYDLPISMNQDQDHAVKASLSFILDEEFPKAISSCGKPIGRIFFNAQGDIIQEADIYLSESCYCYVFMENNKAKYANPMAGTGQNFFEKIISQYKGSN